MKKLFTILMLIVSAFAFSANIYIDPENELANPNGSLLNPYKTWTQVNNAIADGNHYLIKCGVEFRNGNFGTSKNLNNVTFGCYGSGANPKLIATASNNNAKAFDLGGRLNNVEIRDLEITATNPNITCLVNICNVSNNVRLINLTGYNAGWGIRCRVTQVAAPNNTMTNVLIENCTIHSVNDDGMYLYKIIGLTVKGNTVWNVNRNWGPGVDQSNAAGDDIQAINCAKQKYIGNHLSRSRNLIDNSDRAGNKFCLILSGTHPDVPDAENYCLIENNTFISPKTTNQNGAAVYIGNGRHPDIEFNFNVVIGDRYGSVTGISGLWYESYSNRLKTNGNVYVALRNAIVQKNPNLNKLEISDELFIGNGTAYPTSVQKPVLGCSIN